MPKICTPKRCYKLIKKSPGVMGEYIALHGLVPNNELPKHLRGKIPENEVWIRADNYHKNRIKNHEKIELSLMEKGMKYKQAHKIAEQHE